MDSKKIKISTGEEIEIPSIDVTENTWGLLLASKLKLSELLKKKESKRTELDNIKIDYVNAIIVNCQMVLDIGIMPEKIFINNSKMKVVA